MDSQQKLQTEYRISLLVAGALRGDLNPEDERELQDWLQASEANRIWLRKFSEEAYINEQIKKYHAADKAAVWNKTLSKIESAGTAPVEKVRVLWKRIAAAAAVLLIVGAAVYLFKTSTGETQGLSKYAGHIKPGGNKAYLITSDGKRISLTNAANGKIADEAGVSIVKNRDGQLVYKVRESASTKYKLQRTYINTIETPRGGQYQVELPDGTKVWLNAASTLKFPSTFSRLNHNRTVEMIGEAYFEVFKDKDRPFIVKSNGQEIKVLGTHFNIKGYLQDGDTKTTLLEGAVQVSTKDRQKVILKPGQQALVKGNKINVQQADLELAVAWKNNKFMFEQENIRNVMAMLERWYDIDVIYQGELTDDLFGGSVSRTDNITEVLKSLELTGKVHFKIEGRRVLVTK